MCRDVEHFFMYSLTIYTSLEPSAQFIASLRTPQKMLGSMGGNEVKESLYNVGGNVN
jgi:hypothetical protein